MKKTFLSLLTIGLLLAPTVGLAQVVAPDVEVKAPDVNVMVALDNIVNWAFTLLLIVAVLCIIIAGYFFVTAAGDPEKVKRARDFVLYALIGVIVAVLAKGLIALVKKITGAEW